MALLREHFHFGVTAGGLSYLAVFGIAFYLRVFPDFYTLLLSFVLGFLALVAGSLLPDMDAPRSPIHDTFLVFFGSSVALIMQKFGFTSLALLIAPLLSVWVDRNHLPSHRGFVHTVGCGIVFGLLLSAGLYFFLTKSLVVCLWTGFSLAIGHMLHLMKDRAYNPEKLI